MEVDKATATHSSTNRDHDWENLVAHACAFRPGMITFVLSTAGTTAGPHFWILRDLTTTLTPSQAPSRIEPPLTHRAPFLT